MLSFYDYIHMFFTFLLEISVCTILLMRHKTAFRKGAAWRIPLAVVLTVGASVGAFFLAYVMPWNTWTNILVYTLLFVFIIVSFLIVYERSLKKIMIVCLVAFTMQHMTYQVSVMVFDTGLRDTLLANMGYDSGTALYTALLVLLRIVVYVFLYFTLVRLFLKNSHYILRPWFIVGLSLAVYLIAIMANAAAKNNISPTDYVLTGIVAAVLFFCCVLFDFFVVGGFKLAERREEALLMKSTYEAKMMQYEMTEKNIDFINMKCHDLRKFVRALRQKQEKLTDEEYQIIEDSLRIYDTGVRTGSPTLDTLFQDKALYCKAHNIELTVLVDGTMFKDFAQNDIHFLFMNILDNAIEAVEKVSDPAKRTISLTTYSRKGEIIIEEMNYFEGEIRTKSDGSFISSKPDAVLHGYGTKSIAYITGRYDGVLTIDGSDGIFRLRIVF